MKDERYGTPITELVTLKRKMYLFIKNGLEESNNS